MKIVYKKSKTKGQLKECKVCTFRNLDIKNENLGFITGVRIKQKLQLKVKIKGKLKTI